MKREIISCFLFSLSLCSISAQELSRRLTSNARQLLNDAVDDLDFFISSHPVLRRLNNFDLLDPEIHSRRSLEDAVNSENTQYSFEAHGEVFSLQLNRDILHDEKGIPHILYQGDTVLTSQHSVKNRRELHAGHVIEYMKVECIYSGKVLDPESGEVYENSMALVSFCNDEIRGHVRFNDGVKDALHLQPIRVPNHSTGRSLTVAFRDLELIDEPWNCATEAEENIDLNLASRVDGDNLEQRASTQSFVEVLMVNDKARFDRYTVGIFQHTLFLHQLSNALYSVFPGSNAIKLRVTAVVSMSVRNAWNLPVFSGTKSVFVDDSSKGADDGYLSIFKTYINRVISKLANPILGDTDTVVFDVAHLLSGEDFITAAGSQTVVGLASTGAVCSTSAQGVTQDLFIDAETTTVMTHEIGHNLGFQHTNVPLEANNPDSACFEENLKRIMDAVGTSATSWSSCSQAYFQSTVNDAGKTCINSDVGAGKNVNGPYCGNGIVEDGEECDCGARDCTASGQNSVQFDPCCDGSTCQLAEPEFTCSANDLCCNLATCDFQDTAGKVCREKRDGISCDQEEICTGDSKDCPDDILADFGSGCSIEGFGGNCFRGLCVSGGLQCSDAGNNRLCSATGDGDDFCQGIGDSGLRCLGSSSNCASGSFPKLTPEDGTECDPGKGCLDGVCVKYSEIPLVDQCLNFELDEGETDIDCGGDICLPCVAGKNCTTDGDCFGFCNSTSLKCVGVAGVEFEDIFDVIGQWLKDHKGAAAFIYMFFIAFACYLIYSDVKARRQQNAARKTLGEVRQETFRNSMRHSVESLDLPRNSLNRDSLRSNPNMRGGVRNSGRVQEMFPLTNSNAEIVAIEIPELSEEPEAASVHQTTRTSRGASIPVNGAVNMSTNPRYRARGNANQSTGSRSRAPTAASRTVLNEQNTATRSRAPSASRSRAPSVESRGIPSIVNRENEVEDEVDDFPTSPPPPNTKFVPQHYEEDIEDNL